jgi:carbon starvation protein
MFGIANQLLAAVALCVATTILFNSGKARFAWVTILPLTFVGSTTLVAGWKSITSIFWPLAQKPETAVQGYINTFLTALIMTAAIVILIDSIRLWTSGGKRTEPVSDAAMAEAPTPVA